MTPREAIRARKSGPILYISPSPTYIKLSLERMLRAAVCKLTAADACSCPDCFTVIKSGRHPTAQIVEQSNFAEQMSSAFAYPLPVMAFSNLHEVPYNQQMQLLIWLETYSATHVVLMTATSEQLLLPTIRSRSMIFREIPKESLTEEERTQTFYQIKAILECKARPDDWPVEELPAIARRMQLLLVEDLERRLLPSVARQFTANSDALTTLVRLVSKYLENPLTHNLPLLLRSYSTIALQNIR